MAVFRRFTAGLFEGWTRLALSDRCRIVVVSLTVPCAVALALAVRPPSPQQPSALFLGLGDLEAASGVQWDPWGVVFEDGGYADKVPAVRRAEVIIELDRISPGASLVIRDASGRPVAGSASR